MATTIKLKNSVTTTNAPSSLVQGEVAINITDKKVWVGNAATTPIQLLGAGSSASFGALTCTSLTNSGLTSGRVTYASTGGLLADSANFTFNGTTVTMANDASISGLTVGKGAGSVSSNTTLGNSSLLSNTTGQYNTAIGQESFRQNTTGVSNTGVGYQAGYLTTTGSRNSAFGTAALPNNTTASDNTAVGYFSLLQNTTGANNTSVGSGALASNTTASNNTAVGYQAGYSNTTGGYNTVLGFKAGYTNSTGTQNLYIGGFAGYNATSNYNTFVGATNSAGSGCGESVTTGSKNTILGGYSGNQGGLDIRTLSNRIVISDGDGNPRIYVNDGGNVLLNKVTNDDTSDVGMLFYGTGPFTNTCDSASANTLTLYNKNATNNGYRFYVNTNGGIYNYSGNNSNLSDERTKKNIELASDYLAKICSIPVKTFNYKDEPVGEQKTLGVIAQDVEAVAPELINNKGFGETKEGESPLKSIYTTDMMFAMMKAIQELKAEVDSLKAQLNK